MTVEYTSSKVKTDVKALLGRLGRGDVSAVPDAMWLADDLEERQLRDGLANSHDDADYEECGRLNALADRLRGAIARMASGLASEFSNSPARTEPRFICLQSATQEPIRAEPWVEHYRCLTP